MANPDIINSVEIVPNISFEILEHALYHHPTLSLLLNQNEIDYFSVQIPNLRYQGESGDYDDMRRYIFTFGKKNDGRIIIEITYVGEEIDTSVLRIQQPGVFFFERVFTEQEQCQLVDALQRGLELEAERQDAKWKGRELTAMRQTIGSKRPYTKSSIPNLFAVLHGPEAQIARFITGLPGSAEQQEELLKRRAAQRGRTLGTGTRGGRRIRCRTRRK